MQCTMNCQLINQKTKRSRQPKIQESHLRNAGKNKLVYVKKYALAYFLLSMYKNILDISTIFSFCRT